MASAPAVRILLLGLAPAAAALRGAEGRRGLVAADMHPRAVSQLLSKVERSWEDQALTALAGTKSDASALSEVQESCQKITKSIVDGASGSKDKVIDYMKDVCNEDEDQHDVSICGEFSKAVESFMSDDEFQNRQELNYEEFCTGFYESTVVAQAKATAAAEKAKAEAAAKADAEKHQQERAQEAHENAAQLHADQTAAANKIYVAQVQALKADSLAEGLTRDDATAQRLIDAARKMVTVSIGKETAEEDARSVAAEGARHRKVDHVERRTSQGVALTATRR